MRPQISSNARNFPKDFFRDSISEPKAVSANVSRREISYESIRSAQKLKPLKLVAKLMRRNSPIVSPQNFNNLNTRNTQEFDATNIESLRTNPKHRRRNFFKSVSVTRNKILLPPTSFRKTDKIEDF